MMRKIQKRLLQTAAVCMSAMLLLPMAACGGKQGEESGESTGGNTPPPVPAYDTTRTALNTGEESFALPTDYATYHNPIELYDNTGMLYNAGDPFIMRFNGKYYLYSSIDNTDYKGDVENNIYQRHAGKIPVWVSDDMIDWTWGGFAYEPPTPVKSEFDPSFVAFAPEVVYYKGYFYMCASQRGHGHYFYRAESPLGPFTLVNNTNYLMGIDGSFYLHDDGTLYFMGANNQIDANRIAYYKLDFVEEEGEIKVEINNTDPDPDLVPTAYLNGWTEGPGVIRRNGYSYVTYTGNHVDSAGYRVGYSSVKGNYPFEGLVAKNNNITIISSGIDNAALPGYGAQGNVAAYSNFRGTGHSSNAYGPNLDSIYTAFHIADRRNYNNDENSGARKYAVTQYFTNNSYLYANGLANLNHSRPAAPSYYAAAEELTEIGGALVSTAETEAIYTAELNLALKDGEKGSVLVGASSETEYYLIEIDGTALTYSKVSGESKTQLATATVAVSTNKNAVHTVKVINGSNAVHIYYDNMLTVTSSSVTGAGRVGYAEGTPSMTVFTNDAFGSSDFEAPKDLTGTFAAYSYLKGENRGFSIAGAAVKADGVRVGEKESTEYVASLDATKLTLKEEDWVKYLVEAPAEDDYALNFLLGKESGGCIYEVIIDGETVYHDFIPKNAFGESDYANVHGLSFHATAGMHTLKLRVFHGTLGLVNISSVSGGEGLGEKSDSMLKSENALFKSLVGPSYAYTKRGLTNSTSDARTLLVFGNKGVTNFEFSIDARIVTGTGGLLFRMNNYSYVNTTKTQGDCFLGYHLMFNNSLVQLNKNMYNKSTSLELIKPDSDCSFRGGQTVKIGVRAINGQITVWLNNVEAFSVYDSEAILTGYIGLWVQSGSCVIFSNFYYNDIFEKVNA